MCINRTAKKGVSLRILDVFSVSRGSTCALGNRKLTQWQVMKYDYSAGALDTTFLEIKELKGMATGLLKSSTDTETSEYWDCS